jgi:hypothetical protein
MAFAFGRHCSRGDFRHVGCPISRELARHMGYVLGTLIVVAAVWAAQFMPTEDGIKFFVLVAGMVIASILLYRVLRRWVRPSG